VCIVDSSADLCVNFGIGTLIIKLNIMMNINASKRSARSQPMKKNMYEAIALCSPLQPKKARPPLKWNLSRQKESFPVVATQYTDAFLGHREEQMALWSESNQPKWFQNNMFSRQNGKPIGSGK
jgi:hypothetical protein